MTGPRCGWPDGETLAKEALIEVPLRKIRRMADLACMLAVRPDRPTAEVQEIAAEIEKLAEPHIDPVAIRLDEIRRLGT